MSKKSTPIKITPDYVYVLFDTSAIHPGSDEETLLSSRLHDYANLRANVPYELCICIPDIALKERRYQLEQKAISTWDRLVVSLRFLGQSHSLTRETSVQTIFTNLEKEVKDLGVDILPLEYSSVDLESICAASIERRPPFSASGEKGFRDALIVETIAHFVGTLPTNTKEYLVIVVSGDKLLLKTLEERNLPSSVELISDHGDALNRLVAISEGLTYSEIQNILLQADEMFMSKDWKSGLFCEEKLEEKILEKHSKEILAPMTFPPAYFEKEDFFISTPSLTKVEGNVWHFATFVEFQGGIWVAGYPSDIDYLENSILKHSVKRQVLDSNDNFLSALLTKLTIMFRIDWYANRLPNSHLSNASISVFTPYMRRSMGPDYMFSGIPEMLGFRSPHDGARESITLQKIDRCHHGYVKAPKWWTGTHREQQVDE